MEQQGRPRLAELAGLSGLISPQTGEILCTLAAEVDASHAVVEIGSFRGKSTCYLAEGCRTGKGARVWAVDPWDSTGNVDGRHGYARSETFEVFDLQVETMGLREIITPTRGFSLHVARTWNKPIGLLFIDGSHDYGDVKADFEAWSPSVVPGSVVAFDDYDTPKNPGVKRFVDELQEETACQSEIRGTLALIRLS